MTIQINNISFFGYERKFRVDELTKEDCDHWHYNPRESVFKFSGGDTGGGGAGRGLEDE